mmetsp:Transcript_3682/g.9514  ORF Transcript_3682/g.9514 Transcript_3682/m.9514 type:complete len:238 (+) Transcript_3682:6-719(+)
MHLIRHAAADAAGVEEANWRSFGGAGKRHRLGCSLSSRPKKAPPPAQIDDQGRAPSAPPTAEWPERRGSLQEPTWLPPFWRSKTCREEEFLSRTPRKRPSRSAREPGSGTWWCSLRRRRLGTNCCKEEDSPSSTTRRAVVATTTQSCLLPAALSPVFVGPHGADVRAESSSGCSRPAASASSTSAISSGVPLGAPPRSSNQACPTWRSLLVLLAFPASKLQMPRLPPCLGNSTARQG